MTNTAIMFKVTFEDQSYCNVCAEDSIFAVIYAKNKYSIPVLSCEIDSELIGRVEERKGV